MKGSSLSALILGIFFAGVTMFALRAEPEGEQNAAQTEQAGRDGLATPNFDSSAQPQTADQLGGPLADAPPPPPRRDLRAPPVPGQRDRFGPPPWGVAGASGGFGAPGGFGPPFGFRGGMNREEIKLLKEFDKDQSGWLDSEERKPARERAKAERETGEHTRFAGPRGLGSEGRARPGFGPRNGSGPRGPRTDGEFGPRGPGGGPDGRAGGRGGFGRAEIEPARPGERVSPEDVAPVKNAPLYEPTVLRTIFLDFDNEDWERELVDFHGTDVDVPAQMTVDGRNYSNVGARFRGASSFGMVQDGHKRSLNVSVDIADPKQRLYGVKTLNLLNSHGDPSFAHSVLFSHIARQYIPAPKVNYVRVVINGESWGLYANAEQFNKDMLAQYFPGGEGARWKVAGRPGGRGGLEYIGENVDDYKRLYEIKTKDRTQDWQALIELCKTLNETPTEELEKSLRPMLDIDNVLWFLALDNALINSDGYWIRASDYNIFRDEQGVFHLIPHDMNESFHAAMGPGADRSRGASGPALDPLVGLEDPTKPLRSKLLAVPSLREQYLKNVHTIAEHWLDWDNLGPVVAQYRELIEDEVEKDTKKLTSLAAFQEATSEESHAESSVSDRRRMSLKDFADARRAYLLDHPEIKKFAGNTSVTAAENLGN